MRPLNDPEISFLIKKIIIIIKKRLTVSNEHHLHDGQANYRVGREGGREVVGPTVTIRTGEAGKNRHI